MNKWTIMQKHFLRDYSLAGIPLPGWTGGVESESVIVRVASHASRPFRTSGCPASAAIFTAWMV